jgi:hypothetical protein
VCFEHPGHTYGGFVPSLSEWGMTGGVWWDAKFDSTQFQKKVPQSEFVCKSYDSCTEARLGYGSGRQNMTRNQNRVR